MTLPLQTEKDPLPWREARLLQLRPPKAVLRLSARSAHDENRSFRGEVGASRREAGSPLKQQDHPPLQEHPNEEAIADPSEKSVSVSPPAQESTFINPIKAQTTSPAQQPPLDIIPSAGGPGPADVGLGIRLYFEYCHRQPIWCFEYEDVGDFSQLSEELACSILALTARFSPMRERLQKYNSDAKRLVMMRIASSRVEVSTIESLCLLAYSSFIDGNVSLGQFHLGLAFQLSRSAMLDVDVSYSDKDPNTQRKRKLFWSLQVLEQYYGKQTGLLSLPTEILRPSYASSVSRDISRLETENKPPPLPRDDLGHSRPTPEEPGVWNTSVHLGWVWSRVRKYVSDCAQNIFNEPWRRDSMYGSVLSDFMDAENRIPMCHRYDTVKFYERKVEELKVNRPYWTTWLKEQFTYHAIQTVLNHPFLYIIGAQHNSNLAIPNTFWRRSSELALIHSTWIVRLIDMVVDKQVQLTDPFFGHIAAIAATVHLYYCCAAAAKLKHKSNTDFAKCRRFLKCFIPFSPACAALEKNLDKMARIASGSDSVDVEDWMPSRIYLSVPLMWDILQFTCVSGSPGIFTKDLAHALHRRDVAEESSVLEIVVATSPEISINTADGGQEAPTASSYKASVSPGGSTNPSNHPLLNTEPVPLADDLTMNTTPWLYEDSSQFAGLGDIDLLDAQSEAGDENGMIWWEGDVNHSLFSHF
ncbi:Transcription factor [Cordyceps fumosorosea ARSEF 2679]|uniref:Transcription factor n=1 Tax=Cordyceps fumosorosea (strain ARSEF 2679) TaxID=1081104 RepID=A0A167Q5V5_CORFA|nr:Transcription factor [Cordyceps fumosorosea ARSEF 2679]OAA57324.1 Transcription factor [Cordyceps fumosorosea ARSEF 2679]